MADAPVPTTTTRLPASARSRGHCAEWTTAPRKVSSPGTSGRTGLESAPVASTSTRAVSGPCVVSTRQRAAAASHRAPSTVQPYRMRSVTPCAVATCRRYAWISAAGAKRRVHAGLRANEKE